MENRIVCAYCSRVNPAELDRCEACGAPLEKGPVENREIALEPVKFQQPLEMPDQTDELEQVQRVIQSAGVAYGTLWRTIAEAIAIALVAFGLGVLGAITNLGLGALLGAVMVGGGVGLVVKGFWPTLIGAPLGALLGSVMGGLIWVSLGEPRWVVVTTSLGALIGAILGSQRSHGQNWWERFRPLFGVLGAGLFALLGLFIGESLQQIVLMFS